MSLSFRANPARPPDVSAAGGRQRARPPVRRLGRLPDALTVASASHGALLVEALGAEAVARHRTAWVDLVGRALEPNVFLEPGFAVPAARLLAPKRAPIFVLVWAGKAPGGPELVALCPLAMPRLGFPRALAVWFHDLAALGAPLLDARLAQPALQAILAWMAQRVPRCRALVMSAVPVDGPTREAVRAVAAATGRSFATLDVRARAFLRHTGVADAARPAELSSGRAKELRRQRRKLGSHGALSYVGADAGEPLLGAMEAFLALEAKGWKGRRGTALLSDAARAAFVRDMTQTLALEGKCRVDALMLGDEPVAMGVILSSGGRDFFWKTAFDEAWAALSPGVQFTLDLTRVQQQRRGVDATDSCAMPDHPMIDRVWADRLTIADLALAVRPGGARAFEALIARERLRRRARAWLKSLLAAWRKRAAVRRMTGRSEGVRTGRP